MIAAHALRLASYWISAPLFCADTVREGLELPPEFEPQALVVVGYPEPGVSPRPRSKTDVAAHVLRR